MRCPSSLQRLPLVLISFLPVTGREETKVWATCLRQHRGQVTSLTLKPELQAREGEDPSGTGSLPALWTLDDPSHTAWGCPQERAPSKASAPESQGVPCSRLLSPPSCVTVSLFPASLRVRLPVWKVRPTATTITDRAPSVCRGRTA